MPGFDYHLQDVQVTSRVLRTSMLIANFTPEGPGNVAKPSVRVSFRVIYQGRGVCHLWDLASHWGTTQQCAAWREGVPVFGSCNKEALLVGFCVTVRDRVL